MAIFNYTNKAGTTINMSVYNNWKTGSSRAHVLVTNKKGQPAKTATVQVKHNDTLLDTVTVALPDATSANVVENAYYGASKSMFATAGDTTSKKLALTVIVITDDETLTVTGNTLIGPYLEAASDMAPAVNSVTIVPRNPEHVQQTFGQIVLSGITKISVYVSTTAGSNSPIARVRMRTKGGSWSTMSYNSSAHMYEKVFNEPVTSDETYTFEVTDDRGLSGTLTYPVNPTPYTLPSAVFDYGNTYRCNQAGDETLGGMYVKVKAHANIDALSGNQIRKFGFYVLEDGSTAFNTLTQDTQSGSVQIQNGTTRGTITVVLVIQDMVSDEIEKTLELSGADISFMLKRSALGTFLGIGEEPPDYGGIYGYRSSLNLPANGVYVVNEIPVDSTHEVYIQDGSSFGKDFLKAHYTDRDAAENQTCFFSTPVDKTGWLNFPQTITNDVWEGIRYVIQISALQTAVMILETAPHTGRIWYHATTPLGLFTDWYYIDSTAV